MIVRNNLKRLFQARLQRRFSDKALNGEVNSMFAEFVTSRKNKLGKEKAYVHPLEDEDKPISVDYAHVLNLYTELVGPEQVSMHYENFWTSRRYILTFFGAMAFCNYCYKIQDLNWVLWSTMNGLPMYFMFFVYYYELPKYQFFPILNTFYEQTIWNELKMMHAAFPEEVQDVVNKNMKEALDQFDYLLLHKKFNSVKQQVIETFLQNQELELKQSVKERAHDLLNMAFDYERHNQKSLLDSIVKNVQAELETIQKNPTKEILDASFESALIGIKEGKMSYKNDQVLPFIIKKIQSEVGKFKHLKPEE